MKKRKIEIFSAGCSVCEESIQMVKRIACSSCEIVILDMKDSEISRRAKSLGIQTVPAIAVNGKLLDCCNQKGPNEETLRAAGVGQP
ncbi:MAG: thioredoxin family protein [Bdellovibrionales bacterium]|nr:thioredoxin family protein [Bdellovibrionales bacterium]